jgi:hypothetical protein
MNLRHVLDTTIAAFALGLGVVLACNPAPSGASNQSDAAADAGPLPDAQDEDAAQDAPEIMNDAQDAAEDAAGDARDAARGEWDGEQEDAGKNDAACSGLLCNGRCIAASDCQSCTGSTLLCAAKRACVSACAGCADSHGVAMPIGCYACDANHENPMGTCQYDDANSFCLSGDYFGAYPGGAAATRCPCSDGGVGACPGANQVCVPLGLSGGQSFCLACGEVSGANLQGQSCMGGGTCQSGQHVCQ